MKATVLADNIGEGPLAGEWGLSIYIEYENKRFYLIPVHRLFLWKTRKPWISRWKI